MPFSSGWSDDHRGGGAARSDAVPPTPSTFTVERALRGLEGASAGVTTGTGGGDCGYAFKAGERYLVYAYKAQDGQLHAGIGSKPVRSPRLPTI